MIIRFGVFLQARRTSISISELFYFLTCRYGVPLGIFFSLQALRQRDVASFGSLEDLETHVMFDAQLVSRMIE